MNESEKVAQREMSGMVEKATPSLLYEVIHCKTAKRFGSVYKTAKGAADRALYLNLGKGRVVFAWRQIN